METPILAPPPKPFDVTWDMLTELPQPGPATDQPSFAELEREIRQLRFKIALMETVDKTSTRMTHDAARAARDMAAVWRRLRSAGLLTGFDFHPLVRMMDEAVAGFGTAPLECGEGTAEAILGMARLLEELEEPDETAVGG